MLDATSKNVLKLLADCQHQGTRIPNLPLATAIYQLLADSPYPNLALNQIKLAINTLVAEEMVLGVVNGAHNWLILSLRGMDELHIAQGLPPATTQPEPATNHSRKKYAKSDKPQNPVLRFESGRLAEVVLYLSQQPNGSTLKQTAFGTGDGPSATLNKLYDLIEYELVSEQRQADCETVFFLTQLGVEGAAILAQVPSSTQVLSETTKTKLYQLRPTLPRLAGVWVDYLLGISKKMPGEAAQFIILVTLAQLPDGQIYNDSGFAVKALLAGVPMRSSAADDALRKLAKDGSIQLVRNSRRTKAIKLLPLGYQAIKNQQTERESFTKLIEFLAST